jgi:N-acetylglucosaminyl-diphospho-decaprenol L-rhamnosyltransferase
MLVDRARWEAAGRFDERYFLFYEEADLGRRLRAQGSEVHLVADAEVVHAVGSSRASVPGSASDHYFESAVRYLRRWSGAPTAMAYTVVAVVSWTARSWAGRVPVDEARRVRRGVLRGWSVSASVRR